MIYANGAIPAQQRMQLLLQEVHPLTLHGQIVEDPQGNPTQKVSVYLLSGAPGRCSWCQAGKEHEAATAVCVDRLHTALERSCRSSKPADLFHPLPKEHACALVNVKTVMHSTGASY